jgi:muramoyltetrapeptide carboxypeptidase
MGSSSPIKPRALARGDLLGVVAPASGIKPEMLAAGIRELESLGFKTRLRDDIETVDDYLAGSVDRRLEEFREMLEDPGVKGIVCARGGYGSGHLLAQLQPDELARHPKVFCGASDITMLLAAYARARIVAFHGPMVATTIRQGGEGYDRDLMMRMLVRGEAVSFDTTGCEILGKGSAQGRLTGGCLSLIVSTLATEWEIDTRDSILVVEDIDTKPYEIDRMLTQLRQAGKTDHVRAFVFGEMPGCVQHPGQKSSVKDVIRALLADLAVPILYGFPTGHSSKPNAIVPFGVLAEISLGEDATFRLLEAAVTTS